MPYYPHKKTNNRSELVFDLTGREVSDDLKKRIEKFMTSLHKETGAVCSLHIPEHSPDIPLVNQWLREMPPLEAADVLKGIVEEVSGLPESEITDTSKRDGTRAFYRVILYELFIYVYGLSITDTGKLLEVSPRGIDKALRVKSKRKPIKQFPFAFTRFELATGIKIREKVYLKLRAMGLFYVAPAPERLRREIW